MAGFLEASRADSGVPCGAFDGGLRLQTLEDKYDDAVGCAWMCYVYNVASASGKSWAVYYLSLAPD